MVRGIRDGTQGSHKWKLTWSQSSLSKTAVVPKSYVMAHQHHNTANNGSLVDKQIHSDQRGLRSLLPSILCSC